MKQEVWILFVHYVVKLRDLVDIVFFRSGLIYSVFNLVNLLLLFVVVFLTDRLAVAFLQQFNQEASVAVLKPHVVFISRIADLIFYLFIHLILIWFRYFIVDD